jgi:hypothetical protein
MAVTPARVYRVDLAGTPQLVRASTPAQALAHAARGVSQVRVATQDDLIDLVAAGIKPSTAGEDAEAQPQGDPPPQA